MGFRVLFVVSIFACGLAIAAGAQGTTSVAQLSNSVDLAGPDH